VVPVGFNDANLVGVYFLIYAKFVDVSDSWIGRFLREEFGFGERLGSPRVGLTLRSSSRTCYTRKSSCEVSVKVA